MKFRNIADSLVSFPTTSESENNYRSLSLACEILWRRSLDGNENLLALLVKKELTHANPLTAHTTVEPEFFPLRVRAIRFGASINNEYSESG